MSSLRWRARVNRVARTWPSWPRARWTAAAYGVAGRASARRRTGCARRPLQQCSIIDAAAVVAGISYTTGAIGTPRSVLTGSLARLRA